VQVVAELVQGVGGVAGVTLERGGELAGSLAVQPVTGRVLPHALSFSGKAVHRAVDSVSDSRFAVAGTGRACFSGSWWQVWTKSRGHRAGRGGEVG
jgi:hypothetical protein